jgi:hypothetical protein
MDRRSTELEGRGLFSREGGIGRYRENVLDRAAATQDGCLLGALVHILGYDAEVLG